MLLSCSLRGGASKWPTKRSAAVRRMVADFVGSSHPLQLLRIIAVRNLELPAKLSFDTLIRGNQDSHV